MKRLLLLHSVFCTLSFFALGTIVPQAAASELRHQFINPNFGGNPFNAQPLLNSAVLQNDFADSQDQGNDTGQLEDFQNRLDRAVLNRLSREIVAEAFGEDSDLSAGTFDSGSFEITVTEDLDGVTIGIVDSLTGDTSTVQVPFF